MSLKQLLSERRDEILAAFVREVERKDLPPQELPRSVIVDHIPVVLDEIATELSRPMRETPDVSGGPKQHTRQRLSVGYDLTSLVREYEVLRRVIVDTAKVAAIPLDTDEHDALARYLGEGMADATAEYVRRGEHAGSANAAAGSEREQRANRKVLAGVSVLVVDDDDDSRDLLRIILESCDAEVHDAGSAREALTTLESNRVDVIVSDIGMPDQDGYSLIREVRALQATDKATVPALALTAFARKEDRSRALHEGFDEHMAKPVEPANLLVSLSELVKRSAIN